MLYDLPPWIVYLFVYLFGAITVGVFSKKQFDVVSEESKVEIPKILKGYPVSYLAGRVNYGRGVFLYIFIYQLAYLLLCSSSIILNLAVGTLGLSGVDVVGFSDVIDSKRYATSLDVAIPLFVSSLILTFAGVSPISDVDGLFRNIAHGAAGVPGNLHAAMEAIESFDFDEFPEKGTAGAARELERGALAIASANNVSQEVSSSLSHSVLIAFTLRPWLTGAADRSLWGQASEARLGQLIEGLKLKLDGLEARLKALKQGENEARRETDWNNLAEEAEMLAEDSKAVFAMFAVNDPDAEPNPDLVDSDKMKELLARTRGNREYQAIAPLHSIAVRAFIYMAIVVILIRIGLGLMVEIPEALSASATQPETIFARLQAIWNAKNWGDFYKERKMRILLDMFFYGTMYYILFASSLGLRGNSIRNGDWKYFSKNGGYRKKYFGILFVVVIIILCPIYILVTAVSYAVPKIDWSDISFALYAGRLALQPRVLIEGVDILIVSAVFCWFIMKFSDLADQGAKDVKWSTSQGKIIALLSIGLLFLHGDELIVDFRVKAFDFFANFMLDLVMPVALLTICFHLFISSVSMKRIAAAEG